MHKQYVNLNHSSLYIVNLNHIFYFILMAGCRPPQTFLSGSATAHPRYSSTPCRLCCPKFQLVGSRRSKMVESKKTETVHSPLVTYASMISLLTLAPPFVNLLWYTMTTAMDGSILKTFDYLNNNGLQGFLNLWPKPTLLSFQIIVVYAAFEALLQLLLPGETVYGPISPTGNRPFYKANGVAAYLVTLVTYVALWRFGIFNPTIVYDHLGEIYSTLSFGSFIFCIFLYIKGHLAPSSTDSGSSGNIIIDFYWGMELYPRIGKYFDIKVFTNCRFGMMSWAVLALTYCIKQYEENGKVADSMLVNTTLMLVYVTKFFWWEAGYWNTMDIAHDRAGFYICWGCLVWVPSVYTSPGMYLVNHPVNLGTQAKARVS
ncbi:7-dehydrocholesterol reductase isoform X3 [Medicago truncatula]|uniref:7-dehydrocholesterol reductase isoform X3 n=1 Tax=Medicago truncatula TaxID=3880 RepID=UPI0019679AD8|nr:7-dehydrocholesterol reductase isoform X3 [Medicago truncatula]